jgi:WD40 repeat protein
MASSAHEERGRLADELNAARIQQHMSIRAAAKIAGVPVATVQGWLSGRYFPTPALRREFTLLVSALGLDARLTQSLWLSPSDARDIDRPPYRGLTPYGVDDSDLYFGRDGESERLARAVLDAKHADVPVVVVIGGSGSGKSSLIASGLAGRECLEDGILAGMAARFLPLTELPARCGDESPSRPEVWIVDQVEDQPSELEGSLGAVGSLPAGVVLVLAMRADAYERLTGLPGLAEPLSRPFIVAPMTVDDVRDVIRRPAERLGARVEDSLIELVLRDAGITSEQGALALGALPLLSNALLVTWTARQTASIMARDDYVAQGGLPGSVDSLAEKVFGEFDEVGQAHVRSAFLTLVHVDESSVTRRKVDSEDLTGELLSALQPFIDRRLVAVSELSDVQIAHDALLTHWSRLTEWISADRDRLRVLDHVRSASRVWDEHDRSPDLLLPLSRFGGMEDLMSKPDGAAPLTAVERAYLADGRAHFATRLQEEQRVNHRLRTQRSTAWVLAAVATALTLITGVLYVNNQAVKQAAQSRQVASNAASLRTKDPNLRAQMALVASELSPTVEGRSALLEAAAYDVPTRWLGRGSATIASSPDGSVVVRGDGAGQLTVWSNTQLTTSPGRTFTVDPGGAQIYGVAAAVIGQRLLVAVAGSKVASVWDVTTEPTELRTTTPTSPMYSAAFSTDGRVAFAGESETWVWTVDGQVKNLVTIPQPSRTAVFVGSLLYEGGAGSVTAWKIGEATYEQVSTLTDSGATPGKRIQAMTVSPDGRTLWAAYNAARICRWDLASGSSTGAFAVGSDWINGLAYSADARHVAVASSDQHTYVVSTQDGSVTRTLDDPSKVTSVAWSGDLLATGGVDGSVRVWQSVSPIVRSGGKPIWQFASDNEGRQWFAAATSGTIELWHVEGASLVPKASPIAPDGVTTTTAIAISPDGSSLAAGARNGLLVTWDLTADGAVRPRTDRIAETGTIGSVSFAPQGDLLAASISQGKETLVAARQADGSWRTSATLATPVPQIVQFDLDRPLLAVGLAANAVQLWDLSDRTMPRLRSTIVTDSTPSVQTIGGGHVMAVGTDLGTVSVYDISVDSAPSLTQVHHDPLSAVYGLTFTPDASLLVAASGDGLLWGWDLSSKALRFQLDGGFNSAYETRFIAQGRILLATGQSGIIRAWDVDASRVRDGLCARIGAALTSEERSRYLPGVTQTSGC